MKGFFVLQNGQKLKDLFKAEDTSVELTIRACEDNLYRLCLRLANNRSDADDLYQQTWLKAIQKMSPMVEKSLKNWLYTVCLNIYRDEYRKKKRRERIAGGPVSDEEKEYAMATATNNLSAEAEAFKKYTNKLLLEKISMLPDRHRMAVVMHYFEGLDYTECAKALDIPMGTLKSRLNSAKKKLRREMEKELYV